MPHPIFAAHCRRLEPLRAERLLDAAQAASVPHMGKDAQGWYDRMMASARGVVQDVVRRATPLFTWNGQRLNSSRALRQKFAEGVNSRVDD